MVKETENGKDNRVLFVKANPRSISSISQEIDTRGVKDIVLKFRYRSTDYKGRGLELRGRRLDGSATFTPRSIKADGQWHEVEWKFNQINGSNKINFIFSVLEGEGEVAFDDITATPA